MPRDRINPGPNQPPTRRGRPASADAGGPIVGYLGGIPSPSGTPRTPGSHRPAGTRKPPAPHDFPSIRDRGGGDGAKRPRPWLGVYFNCCSVYGRLYRRDDGTRYEGRCTRCGAWLDVPIGPGGTSQRFFETT